MTGQQFGEYAALVGDGNYGGIETFEVRNPATGGAIATVAESGEPGVERAVGAAEAALGEWRAVDPGERGRLLRRVADAIRGGADRLARIESAETGRPIRQSGGMVAGSAAYFEYYAGLTDKLEGETVPVPGARLDYTRREPLGVTGHVVPWNASLKLGTRSIAPALACGNTVVAKPSPEAPLSLLEFGELAREVLPAGVLNLVPGDGPQTGAALTDDPRVRGLAFTGSRETGKRVMEAAAANVVPVGLELGGKSPNLVFPDADLERAAEDSVKAFWNAGQVCYAGTRVFVHAEVYGEFTEMLAARTEALDIGPPAEDADVGPVITRESRDRIAEHVENAVADGAHALAGGEIPREEGNFYAPTLLAGVDDDAPVACEELFGPVLTVHEFDDDREAVRRANDTEFGLYAVVWTNDLERAHRTAADLEAGTVAVNEFPATYPQAPFGGYKQSGIGREHGREAIRHYTQVKNVIVNWGDAPGRGG